MRKCLVSETWVMSRIQCDMNLQMEVLSYLYVEFIYRKSELRKASKGNGT